MRRKCEMLIVTIALLTSELGCGGEAGVGYPRPADKPAQSIESESSINFVGGLDLTVTQNPGDAQSDVPAENGESPRLERKIIYNATLDLVVENIANVAAQVEELARQHQGFVAKSSIDTASGRPRSGSWTIRVPVAHYDAFLHAAGVLGELERRTEDSREVTAEYYDLETRIRNKQAEEERLLKHLADSTGKLEDILAVEKELSRVRTEVEQMQGQLRVLQDLTALTTITLSVREIRGYVPTESPTFGTRIRRAWTESIDGLTMAAMFAVIAAVAFIPWLIAVGIPLSVGLLLGRWWLRRKRDTPT